MTLCVWFYVVEYFSYSFSVGSINGYYCGKYGFWMGWILPSLKVALDPCQTIAEIWSYGPCWSENPVDPVCMCACVYVYVCGWVYRGASWTKELSIRGMSRVPPSSVLKSQVGVASGSISILLVQHENWTNRAGLTTRSTLASLHWKPPTRNLWFNIHCSKWTCLLLRVLGRQIPSFLEEAKRRSWYEISD